MIEEATYNGLTVSMDVVTDFEKHRLESFFSKEPETIRWIDELMGAGEVFYDIGANVGVFTLYAALRHPELVVRAFEPAFHNYYRLCRNIEINRAGALAYCLALGDEPSSRAMDLASTESGSASHWFEGGASQREGATPAFSQGALTAPLDTLVDAFGFPVPQHVKVDTDGYEEHFVRGARQTLRDARLRSLLIEVTNSDGSRERIVRAMREAGFHEEHPLNSIPEHSRIRREQSGNAHIENIIFTR